MAINIKGVRSGVIVLPRERPVEGRRFHAQRLEDLFVHRRVVRRAKLFVRVNGMRANVAG